MIDPRLSIIHKRVAPIERILVFSSAKGGVGKSICAAMSALALSQKGFRTGLFDLDFQGASAHILLNAELDFPDEESGIKPLRIRDNLDFMTFAAFSREHPVPLRGSEVTEAMIELLAVTVWGRLDYLIVDMPPGISDEVLNILRFLKHSEFLVVCTPSKVAVRVVERLLEMLTCLKVPILGIIENMTQNGEAHLPCFESPVQAMSRKFMVPVISSIPFISQIDRIIDTPDPLDSALNPGIQQIISVIV